MTQPNRTRTVSYTHLDVYKRQDQESAELCHSVDEFVDSLEKVLSGQVDKRDAGDRVAQSRSIDLVADQLVKAYQQVLEM